MGTVNVYGKSFPICEVYQPIWGQDGESSRSCDDRLRTIMMADDMFDDHRIWTRSTADIGCNLGYFLFRLSEGNDKPLVGIDRDKQAIAIANHIKREKGVENVTFISASASAKSIPKADTYFVFSLLHHIMARARFDDGIFLQAAAEHASTIYVELATHLEWPHWANKLVVDGNPYLYWMRELDRITGGNFIVRIVGMHRTHLNTIRPMYQLKRKVNESFFTSDHLEYKVYDKWRTPYRGYHAGELSPTDIHSGRVAESNSEYRYASRDGRDWFIKKEQGKITVEPKIEGLLLSDIIKFSMLNFYDVVKIGQQLTHWTNGDKLHTDANPWNFLVTEDSELIAIDDTKSGKVSIFGGDLKTSKRQSCILMSLLY